MRKLLYILFLGMVVIIPQRAVFAEGQSEKEIVIAGIVFQNDLFMRTVQLGMMAAGEEAGVTVLLGNSDNQITKEANLIDTYIARGVDAIVITPIGNNGSSDAALQRAFDAGIDIIYFNTYAGVPSITFVGTSDAEIGKIEGQEARKFIQTNMQGGPLNVATISYRSQLAESAEARTGGFLKQINDLPGYNLVAEQDAWLAEMAVRVVGDVLTANPDITLIGTANDGSLIGSVQAVRNAGLAGKVFVFGVAGSEQVVQMLQADDNILQFSVAHDAFAIGKVATESALKNLAGESVEDNIEVPPFMLSRDDPEGLQEYLEILKSYQQ